MSGPDLLMPSVSDEDVHSAARRHGVCGEIHPEDHIFGFLHNNIQNTTAAINAYFDGGADCAGKLRSLIEEQRPLADINILEFAAGYGRVTRHLGNALPGAKVLSSDIHPEAVSFLQERIGAAATGSVSLPEAFKLDRRFDVVFALSFFSHLPHTSWARWLFALAGHTAADGVLIFTTHGELSRRNLGNPLVRPDGFWFKPESEQHDLSGTEYGSTITLPSYVFGQIARIPNMRLVRFQEGFWWRHQDVYVLLRSA